MPATLQPAAPAGCVSRVEKLTCITPIADVTHDGGTIKSEPLPQLPEWSRPGGRYGYSTARWSGSARSLVLPVTEAEDENRLNSAKGRQPVFRLWTALNEAYDQRLPDPATSPPTWAGCPGWGPAERRAALPELALVVDCEDGVWRCHRRLRMYRRLSFLRGSCQEDHGPRSRCDRNG